MKRSIFILLSLILLVDIQSFAQKSKAKRKNVKRTQMRSQTITKSDTINQSLMLCYAPYGMSAWYLALNIKFQFPENISKPSNYKLVTTNDTVFSAYLKTIPFDTFTHKIILPLYSNKTINCKEFQIARVWTMDSTLQNKYPDLMTFKAVEENNPHNTARIECDGKTTQIMIEYNGETYFATPYLFNKKIYYACYSKNDPSFIKQNFE
ncbi:MAG TPA: hypothetical protein PKA54_07940 [Chitinophagaceae bacterium]|nr:MAG: hypothetical protein UZ11_BCD004000041 [Bacteroidetes bacterium OLB11]HMN33288.1 hypothetical protein [Chitinophagaceae bacterium]